MKVGSNCAIMHCRVGNKGSRWSFLQEKSSEVLTFNQMEVSLDKLRSQEMGFKPV